QQQQHAGVEAEVEFHNFHLPGFAMKAETASRENQKHDPDQQQHTPGRRQLFENRPPELLQRAHPPMPAGVGKFASFNVARIEPIAALRIALELRPQLIDLQAFCNALPETLESSDHPPSAVSSIRRSSPVSQSFSCARRLEGHARWRL